MLRCIFVCQEDIWPPNAGHEDLVDLDLQRAILATQSSEDGILWIQFVGVGPNRYWYMNSPSVLLVLRDYGCAAGEENMPELTLSM